MSPSRRDLLRFRVPDLPRAPEAGEAVAQAARPAPFQGCSAERVVDERPPPWLRKTAGDPR